MELPHLRYFLAVVETGNFRRAAEQSFVAQSALSQQIARLEAELGTALFFRNTRSVRLTSAGEVLRPLARRILAEVEHATGEMAALVGLKKGSLRLGIIQTGAGAIDIIALISRYHERYPGIDLHVQTEASSDMAAAVAGGELDVAIVALPRPALPPGLTHHRIVDDPLVAVMSRAASRGVGDEIALPDLLERGPFIHYLSGSGLRHSITAAFERAKLTVRASLELDQIVDMIRLAALGVGVTVVPKTSTEPIVGEARHTADFAAVALTDRAMVHAIGVVYDADRLPPAGAAFLATIPGLVRQYDSPQTATR